jgi:hypothetical protein
MYISLRRHFASRLLCRCSLLAAWLACQAVFVLPAVAADPAVAVSEYPIDPASVVRFGPAWRRPQSGWVLLHIEGKPYERGYQHGRLLAAEIVDYIDCLAKLRNPKGPHEAWRDMRLFSNAMFLRKFAPEFLEEMKGIADGAASAGAKYDGRRIDFLDIVAVNADVEIQFLDTAVEATQTGIDAIRFEAPQYSQRRAAPKEHCSAFVATGPATADGRIVIGHITMSSIWYVKHYNIWLDIQPETGHRVVFQGFPGAIQSGLDYYINDAGMVVSETTVRQTRFNVDGESLSSRIREAVQYAESIDDVVRILGDASNGLYSNQWLMGDLKTNEIAMFELGTWKNRLWRSSKNEWPEGTAGFYWGCNNVRDVEVFKETVPDLRGKPANLVLRPKVRDKAWNTIFERHRGRIGEAFAFEAFTTPPLAAFPSCDAKFATAEQARDLKSWGLFGPPLGRTWDPSPEDVRQYADVQPLVSNDWTLLDVKRALPEPHREIVVDLAPFPEAEKEPPLKFDDHHPFAWRGTILPETDADTWLAAAFADYEKVVSYENALRHESGGAALSRSARDLVDLALFQHESRWLAAARRLGTDVPFAATKRDPAHAEWYDIASGKGVMLLAALRDRLGGESFDRIMDAFGQAHAGRPVSTAEFRRHFEQAAGRPAAALFKFWLDGEVTPAPATHNIWTIYSFEAEPDRALIVYGTSRDRAAMREAAELLQREIARRFSNTSIPIKSDAEVSDAELKDHHLILVGRPFVNRISARCAEPLPIAFGPASFTVRGETYAHVDSAVIAAGDNPYNPRYSAVVVAGLDARSTWRCVQHLDADEDPPPPQVLLFPAGSSKPRKLRIPPVSRAVANP